MQIHLTIGLNSLEKASGVKLKLRREKNRGLAKTEHYDCSIHFEIESI